MGKKKKSNNSVFKVAGAKSLKTKARAKPVTGNLKNIHIKKKIAETDKQLKELQHLVRHEKPSEVSKKEPQKASKKECDYVKTKQLSQEALKNLEVLQL